MGIQADEHDRPSTIPPGLRPVRELNELRTGSSASLAELREFLTQLKGRKPQEVIGIVSASLLAQSMMIAMAAVVSLLVLFTLGPYLVYGPPQAKKSPAAQVMSDRAIEAETAPESSVVETGSAATSHSSTSPSPVANEPDLKRGSEAMGLDESKQADPSKNPLDSPDLDKLLDGLDP